MWSASLKVYYFVLLFSDEVVSKYLQYVIKDFKKKLYNTETYEPWCDDSNFLQY